MFTGDTCRVLAHVHSSPPTWPRRTTNYSNEPAEAGPSSGARSWHRIHWHRPSGLVISYNMEIRSSHLLVCDFIHPVCWNVHLSVVQIHGWDAF